jgi:hypothetical protein
MQTEMQHDHSENLNSENELEVSQRNENTQRRCATNHFARVVNLSSIYRWFIYSQRG